MHTTRLRTFSWSSWHSHQTSDLGPNLGTDEGEALVQAPVERKFRDDDNELLLVNSEHDVAKLVPQIQVHGARSSRRTRPDSSKSATGRRRGRLWEFIGRRGGVAACRTRGLLRGTRSITRQLYVRSAVKDGHHASYIVFDVSLAWVSRMPSVCGI